MSSGTEVKDGSMLHLYIERTKRYLENGLTAAEIAKKLKVNESTVRTWIHTIKLNKTDKRRSRR